MPRAGLIAWIVAPPEPAVPLCGVCLFPLDSGEELTRDLLRHALCDRLERRGFL